MIKSHYNTHKETIHNLFWRSLQIFGKQGIIFIVFILCAKLLLPYEFGVYNYVLAMLFFLIMFCDFGVSTATSKYVAEYSITDKDKLKAVLFNAGLIIIILTVIITVLTLVFGSTYLGDKYIYVLYSLPLIFLAPMTSLYDGIYRGLKKFKQSAIISILSGIISLGFIYFLINSYGLIGALIAQDLFYLILLIGLATGYRDFNFKLNKRVISEIGSYSFTFGIATLGYYLFSRIDILILGHYGYINEIATYELINKIFMIILIPFTILGQVIAPNFTRLFAKGEVKTLITKYKRYVSLLIWTSLVLIPILLFSIPLIIKIFFSGYYNQIFSAIFCIVLLAYSINFFNAPINSGIIVATGYAKLMTWLNIYLGILNLILSIFLINIVGYVGVMYATLISLIIGTIILQIRYYKKITSNEKKAK